tara:strand:+ start:1144 stop:1575 length:432 start_codon:yes stop_codon:yes gene_type:complete
MSENKQPDWDKITEGKIRHGFAIEAFKKGNALDGELMKEIDCWVRYVVDGKVEQVSDKKTKVTKVKESNVSFTKMVDDFQMRAEEINEDAKQIDKMVREKAQALSSEDRDRVIKSLEDGHITKSNLDSCLKRIHDLASADAEL